VLLDVYNKLVMAMMLRLPISLPPKSIAGIFGNFNIYSMQV